MNKQLDFFQCTLGKIKLDVNKELCSNAHDMFLINNSNTMNKPNCNVATQWILFDNNKKLKYSA